MLLGNVKSASCCFAYFIITYIHFIHMHKHTERDMQKIVLLSIPFICRCSSTGGVSTFFPNHVPLQR